MRVSHPAEADDWRQFCLHLCDEIAALPKDTRKFFAAIVCTNPCVNCKHFCESSVGALRELEKQMVIERGNVSKLIGATRGKLLLRGITQLAEDYQLRCDAAMAPGSPAHVRLGVMCRHCLAHKAVYELRPCCHVVYCHDCVDLAGPACPECKQGFERIINCEVVQAQ